MNRREIMDSISSLAKCQGFYSRLYHNLVELKSNDPEKYDEVMAHLEEQNFKDPVDMVMFFET